MNAGIALLAGLLASAPERVVMPEGWYQLEDGYGEAEDCEVMVIVAEDEEPAESPQPQPQPQAPQTLTLDEEIARFRQPDCELVRGRYLARLLELHGVEAFSLDPRSLAALTHTRPPPEVAAYGFNGTLGDPALAPLYGEPPIPPGPLSYDQQLQTLARELLTCQNGPR